MKLQLAVSRNPKKCVVIGYAFRRYIPPSAEIRHSQEWLCYWDAERARALSND